MAEKWNLEFWEFCSSFFGNLSKEILHKNMTSKCRNSSANIKVNIFLCAVRALACHKLINRYYFSCFLRDWLTLFSLSFYFGLIYDCIWSPESENIDGSLQVRLQSTKTIQMPFVSYQVSLASISLQMMVTIGRKHLSEAVNQSCSLGLWRVMAVLKQESNFQYF